MQSATPPSWNFYFCNVNHSLASIYLDLGLRSEAPLGSKPWLLWIWVYFKSPRTDGLSDSGEASTLFEIEDALAQHLFSACRAVLSGRITTEGRREFYFYAETDEGFDKAVLDTTAAFHGYRFDHDKVYDPSWNQYLNVLYPSREQLWCIKNRDLIDLLKRKGDVPSVSRLVRHWLYFPSENARASFRAAALKATFTIESELNTEGPLSFGLIVSRDQQTLQEQMDATSIELFTMAQKFSGDYDGWETPVVTQ